MEKYWNVVQDEDGNVVPQASIQVNNSVSGTAAVIFSDNGITTKPNPLLSDDEGYFEFYAANGRYDVTVTKNNYATDIVKDFLIFDIAAQQVPGFGTPTGNSVINNFPGATATLGQTSATVAEILIILKNIGMIGT